MSHNKPTALDIYIKEGNEEYDDAADLMVGDLIAFWFMGSPIPTNTSYEIYGNINRKEPLLWRIDVCHMI